MIGYLHSELGIGEAARQVITALDAGGIRAAPVGLVAPLSRQGQVFAAGDAADLPYAINLVCVNADGLPGFVAEVGTEWRRDRYSIGLWFWEVSGFPEIFEPSFEMVDEVWVASEHVARALRPNASVPITKVTVPIEPVASGLLTRERLRLPGGPLFLFSFDYHSIFARKNPLGLVDAYKRAFPAAGEATLVLKSINHEKHATSHQDLAAATADRPDILILDRYVSLQEKDSLVAACDCYVSLHRSEGLGLTMAEAMYYGKPVIATGYSGNLDFMTEDNSLLVGHRLVPIGPGAEPYPADGEWAEPDLDDAARHMRWVVEHWEEARALGGRASASIRASHSAQAAGMTMARRLTEVRPSLPPPSTTGSFAAELMGGMGTGHIRERVRAGARTQGAVGGPRGRARDAVLRAIQPFTAHEHDVDESIASLIDEHLEATRRGLEEATRRAVAGDAAVRAQLRGMDRALRARWLRSTTTSSGAAITRRACYLDAVGYVGDATTEAGTVDPDRCQVFAHVEGVRARAGPCHRGRRRVKARRQPVLEGDPDDGRLACAEAPGRSLVLALVAKIV